MKFRLAAAGLLAGVCLAPSVFAGTATVTYFGIVDNTQDILGFVEPAPDYDNAHLFGGGNLEGDFVQAVFVYDTNLGIESTDGSTYDELDGGAAFATASPLISATLFVQQPTTSLVYDYTFTPDYYADVYTSSAQGYIDDIATSTAGDNTYTYISETSAPASLSQSYFGLGYGGGSYFDPAGTNTGKLDTIVFDTLEVSVSYVPEPGAWSLMIVGVGLTGAMLRLAGRRRGVASNS